MFLVPLVSLGCAYLELLEQQEREDLLVSLDSQVQYHFTKRHCALGAEYAFHKEFGPRRV